MRLVTLILWIDAAMVNLRVASALHGKGSFV